MEKDPSTDIMVYLTGGAGGGLAYLGQLCGPNRYMSYNQNGCETSAGSCGAVIRWVLIKAYLLLKFQN